MTWKILEMAMIVLAVLILSNRINKPKFQQHEKGAVEALYDVNGNRSLHVSRYAEDTISQEYESQNCEFVPVVNMVDCVVSVPDHVKLDETHESETENVVGNTEEIVVDVASEANDSFFSHQALEKDDDSASTRVTGPRRMVSLKFCVRAF